MIVSAVKNTWNSMVNILAKKKGIVYTVIVLLFIFLAIPFFK